MIASRAYWLGTTMLAKDMPLLSLSIGVFLQPIVIK